MAVAMITQRVDLVLVIRLSMPQCCRAVLSASIVADAMVPAACYEG